MKLRGIIDFGDLTLDDPTSDLKNLLSDFGEEMLREVLAAYMDHLIKGLSIGCAWLSMRNLFLTLHMMSN